MPTLGACFSIAIGVELGEDEIFFNLLLSLTWFNSVGYSLSIILSSSELEGVVGRDAMMPTTFF